MTVSIKSPTSTTGSIQLNGSDVLTIESDNSVDIDSGTLHVDATNNRIGVGTTSPNHELTIEGVANNGGIRVSNPSGQNNCSIMLTSTGTDNGFRMNYNTTNDALIWNTTTGNGTIVDERMRIDSSGYVGIGTSPSTTLHVKSPTTTSSGIFAATIEQAKTNNATATTGLRVKYTSVTPGDTNHIFRCEDSGGTYRFYVQNNGTHGGTSDRTLKENIVDATDKLADLRKIKVRNYNWIEHGPEGGLKELGFIAQEVEEVFPKLVKENPETGKKLLLDSVFVPILVKALQEAADKIDVLETRIEALEAK
jgi:hypothetical protein